MTATTLSTTTTRTRIKNTSQEAHSALRTRMTTDSNILLENSIINEPESAKMCSILETFIDFLTIAYGKEENYEWWYDDRKRKEAEQKKKESR